MLLHTYGAGRSDDSAVNCRIQAYGGSPDAAAAELGASNCVTYLKMAVTHADIALTPEILDTLSEILNRRIRAAIAAPGAAHYLLISNIAILLGTVSYEGIMKLAWVMPHERCQDLQFSAWQMGAAAAVHLRVAGGCLASADALTAFVKCCASVFKISALGQLHRQHTARTAHTVCKQLDKKLLTADRALLRQQTMLLDLLSEDTSRSALCRKTPCSLPDVSNDVFTCDCGTAAWDAVLVASASGEMIGMSVSNYCTAETLQQSSRMAHLSECVLALAASVACLVHSPHAAEMVTCCPAQLLERFGSITRILTERCVRMAAHLSAACCWMRQQLALSVLSDQDWADLLACSSAAAASLLAAAERWGRTGCWDAIPDADVLRGWPSLARDAAALLHKIITQPDVRLSAAALALQDVGAAAKLQQMLAWVAECPAIATTTATLLEALPALAAIAQADAVASQQLAVKGGPHEWAPVEKTLRRRLPRRMAARLLPMVDAVTAAIAGAPAVDRGDAATAADAAMAALLLVSAGAGLSSALLAPSFVLRPLVDGKPVKEDGREWHYRMFLGATWHSNEIDTHW